MADRKRPRIGITTPLRGGWAIRQFNRFAVWRCGGQPVLVSPGRPVDIGDLDGLVVGGGDDIGVDLYLDDDSLPDVSASVRIDPERDEMEHQLVKDAIAHGRPVLGICRGAQMLNIALGGTLHQDIYTQYAGAPRLRTPLPRKQVCIEPGSRMHEILMVTRCRVNALHHQSIDRCGRGLAVVARDDHGIVQAVEIADARYIVGVQWHPEFLVFDRGQVRLFQRLVDAGRECRRERARQGRGIGAV